MEEEEEEEVEEGDGWGGGREGRSFSVMSWNISSMFSPVFADTSR